MSKPQTIAEAIEVAKEAVRIIGIKADAYEASGAYFYGNSINQKVQEIMVLLDKIEHGK